MTDSPQPDSPDRRPRPAFGEYAPEGWEWTPEGAERDSNTPPAAGRQGSSTPGVPHNLGAKTDGAATPSSPGRSPSENGRSKEAADPAPYRAGEPTARLAPPSGAPKSRLGDRIVTIALLVLGAFGALNSAASLYQLPGTFQLMANAFDVEGFTVPSSLQTLGTVGALITFAVYALNVIYSIQLMRRGKLAFWVPLVAAVIAFIVAFAFTAIAMNQTPELMRELTDPEALSKLLEFTAEMGG